MAFKHIKEPKFTNQIGASFTRGDRWGSLSVRGIFLTIITLLSIGLNPTACGLAQAEDNEAANYQLFYHPQAIDRTPYLAAIKQARSLIGQGDIALNEMKAAEAAKYFQAAKAIFEHENVGSKSNVWSRFAVLEYAHCLRKLGNAFVECGNLEEALSKWTEAYSLFRMGGIISASTSIVLRSHPELAREKSCLMGAKLASANLCLFALPMAGSGSPHQSNAMGEKQYKSAFLLPFSDCTMYSIKEASQVVRGCWDSPAIDLECVLEKVLRGHEIKTSPQAQYFLTLPARKAALFPQYPVSEFPGKKIVLCRDEEWTEDAPFPYQKFSNDDLRALEKQISKEDNTVHNLKSAMQRHLEERWTPERIIDFCRPETQCLIGKTGDTRKTSRAQESFNLSGQLYSSMESRIGKVQWFCQAKGLYSKAVRPSMYLITVSKDGKKWILEFNNSGVTPKL